MPALRRAQLASLPGSEPCGRGRGSPPGGPSQAPGALRARDRQHAPDRWRQCRALGGGCPRGPRWPLRRCSRRGPRRGLPALAARRRYPPAGPGRSPSLGPLLPRGSGSWAAPHGPSCSAGRGRHLARCLLATAAVPEQRLVLRGALLDAQIPRPGNLLLWPRRAEGTAQLMPAHSSLPG